MTDHKAEFEKFITTILSDMTGNAIMGLRDKAGPEGKVNRFYDFAYPGELDKMVEFCETHRNEDVYLSPLIYGDDRSEPDYYNPKGRLRRTPENAIASMGAYQDSDTCGPENFRLRPSVHVETSSGRYQDYWLFSEQVDAHEASEMSRKIAVAHRKHGSDPSSWSANKVLRVPYTTNTSHGFPSMVEVHYTGEMYDEMDVNGAYEDVELESRPIMRLPADVSYESEQDLPDYTTALEKLPDSFDLQVLTKAPGEGTDRSRMRYRLLCDLFRAETLTFEEVLALAWFAPASNKWREDPRNIRGLIAEAIKAQNEIAVEVKPDIQAPAAQNRSWVVEEVARLDLLDEDERAEISGDDNWIERYCAWTRSKLERTFNEAYARQNAWMILSAAFVNDAWMDVAISNKNFNFFGMAIGPSSSGKTSALNEWRSTTREVFGEEQGWNFGADTSPEALHSSLIARDGQVTIFNADEAHGFFAQAANPRNAGLLQKLAMFFDGYVPPINFKGDKENSGKDAHSRFLINMCGTQSGKMSLPGVITPEMYTSGFLARFIWYVSEPVSIAEDSFMVGEAGHDADSGFEPMARQWSAEFADTRKKLKIKAGTKRIPVTYPILVRKRIGEAAWKAYSHYRLYKDGRYFEDQLEPCLQRLKDNIFKAAGLLALEEGQNEVSYRHALLAIREAEWWVHGMVTVAELAEGDEWTRRMDKVEEILRKRRGTMRREVVFNNFQTMKSFEFSMLVETMTDQGRLVEENKDGVRWLTLKE